MEESIYEKVVDELVERQRLVKDELTRRFKRTRPFRMTPISSGEMLMQYNMLTPEKMAALIDTYGEDAVNEMIFEMETLKKKKGGK